MYLLNGHVSDWTLTFDDVAFLRSQPHSNVLDLGLKSEKGVPTPANRADVHHNPAIKDGGGRHSKGEVLCNSCHVERHKQEGLK